LVFIAEPSNLGAQRCMLLHQGSNGSWRDLTQVGTEGIQVGRGTAEVVVLGLEPVVLGFEPVVLGLDLAMHGLKLVMLGTKSLMLGSERFMLGTELAMGRLKLRLFDPEQFVLHTESFVLRLKLFILGFRGGALAIGVELVEARLRNLLRTRASRFRLRFRWCNHQERVIALLAADMLADVDAPNAQGNLTARAVHNDPIALGRSRHRPGGHELVGARRDGLAGGELVTALLAADLLTEQIALDSQAGRAVGTNRDEMRR
jgi:hypothetical protein